MRNNQFPSHAIVKYLRDTYPKGTRVELIRMNDPYTALKPGDRGTVSCVDDTGTVFVDWDNGSTLGVVYRVDHVRKL
ncbi:MAG: DUF4314 domain-containing protein [Firmicutes bacterium]|nr:DUF4314 domain-containing protein [Bacillota bacterium]